MFIVRVTGRISSEDLDARQRVLFGRNRTCLQSAVTRCSVKILCRFWVFIPVADASNAMVVPIGVSQVEVEVIVLIAGAWRLD